MTLLFVLATLIMVILPVIPALLEWHRPTDGAPLKVVRDYDGSAEHFAMRFRDFIEERMGEAFQRGDATPDILERGSFKTGGATLLVGRDQVLPQDVVGKNRETDTVIAGLGSITLPPNIFAKGEVYARGDINVSDRTACRAVLSEQDLTLGAGCAILRWAHAEHNVTTGPRARLWGRLTAGRRITLGEDSVFTRLRAPCIVTGIEPPARVIAENLSRTPLLAPDNLHFRSNHRWMVKEALVVPKNTSHEGDLIAEGAMTVAQSSHILGSLKTHKTMTIERECVIEGSVIAMKNLTIGEGCLIVGPIVGEATVTIAKGCVIGTSEQPTTITAPRIRLAPGVVIFGSVWSREDGRVVAEAPMERSRVAISPMKLEPAL